MCAVGVAIFASFLFYVFVLFTITSSIAFIYSKRKNNIISGKKYVLIFLFSLLIIFLYFRFSLQIGNLYAIVSNTINQRSVYCKNPNGENVTFKDGYKIVTNCKNGKYDGVEKTYSSNGTLIHYGFNKNGSSQGLNIEFDGQGKMTIVDYVFKKNSLSLSNLSSRIADDYLRLYDQNYLYDSDTDIRYQKYHCPGSNNATEFLKVEKCTTDGQYKGLVSKYIQKTDEKGNLTPDLFLYSEAIFSGGIRNGPYKIYDQTGNLKMETTYQDGKMSGMTRFYIEGVLVDEILFQDNLPNLSILRVEQLRHLPLNYIPKPSCAVAFTHRECEG